MAAADTGGFRVKRGDQPGMLEQLGNVLGEHRSAAVAGLELADLVVEIAFQRLGQDAAAPCDQHEIALRLFQQGQEQVFQVHIVVAACHAQVRRPFGGLPAGVVQFADQGLEVDAHAETRTPCWNRSGADGADAIGAVSLQCVDAIGGVLTRGILRPGAQVAVPAQADAPCATECAALYILGPQHQANFILKNAAGQQRQPFGQRFGGTATRQERIELVAAQRPDAQAQAQVALPHPVSGQRTGTEHRVGLAQAGRLTRRHPVPRAHELLQVQRHLEIVRQHALHQRRRDRSLPHRAGVIGHRLVKDLAVALVQAVAQLAHAHAQQRQHQRQEALTAIQLVLQRQAMFLPGGVMQ
ncbi:hypothetical protein G6F31_014608 [Rhizopus arrhizus]|nr:hypothetical protein G6F31_014608 [Rhizopus arrhizus]